MATDLQKDLAEAIVKNQRLPKAKRMNMADLLVSVGYSPSTAKAKPGEIIEAKGVQDALEGWGLTRELVTTALVEDIKEKKGKRVQELTLGAEILRMRKDEGSGGAKVLIINITGQSSTRYGAIPGSSTDSA